MRTRLGVALLAAALATTTVSACAGSSNPATHAVAFLNGGTYTEALTDDPGAFNPHRNPQIVSYMYLLYDSLVNLTPDGEIVSGLAETWQANATSATFQLKAGITCSDGSALTASQVARNINFVGDPRNKSALYGQFTPTSRFHATGDDAGRTVRVQLPTPFSFPLQTIGFLPIICAKGLESPAMLTSASNGTGPFVLSQSAPGDHYTLTVRKGYTWGPNGASTDAPGTPAQIVLKVVANETTAANLLVSGAVNQARVAGPDRQRLTAQSLSHFDEHLITGELWYNQRPGRPGSDIDVRRALSAALDLDQLAKVQTSGNGVRSTGLAAIRPKACSGDTVTGQLPAHDPGQAAALLDRAGWLRSGDGLRQKNGKTLALSLHYAAKDGDGAAAAVELISQKWAALGVRVTLSGDDANALNTNIFQTSDFDALWTGINFTLPSSIVPYVSGATPPAGQNLFAIDNAEYTRLAAQAGQTVGPEGCALWNKAEQALFRDADVVPVAESVIPYFLRKAQGATNGLQAPIPTSIRLLR